MKQYDQLIPIIFLYILTMMREAQIDFFGRNRTLSDNRRDKTLPVKLPKSPFRMAGQLVLDHNFSNRTIDGTMQSGENSLQLMKNSNITTKITKIPDFVHLPKVEFDETQDYHLRPVQSQPYIQAVPTHKRYSTKDRSQVLAEQQQNSVIFESNEKLSESHQNADEVNYNIQRLQMALDYVDLQETQSLTFQRKTTKRRLCARRQKEKELQKQRERVKRQRERNMEMVSGFLSGKATFMWLFVLGKSTSNEDLNPLREIYKSYFENDYEIPICKNYEEATKFLKIQSCFFKVVSDLENSPLLISETQHNKNIIAIYIYNPQKEKGVNKAFELKRNSRKIRGMFMDLTDAAQLAQEEIENEAKFIRVGQDLQRQRNRLRFPAFFILSGVDNTDITSYRMCLYGSLSIKEKNEREIYLKEFTDMVQLRYLNNESQLRNLEEYKRIDHFSEPDEKKHRDIIGFYVRETFYYALLNAMLRLSRNSEEFRPCVIPFNETYLAIKHLYKQYLGPTRKKISKFTAYRGAKLRNSDVKSLQIGSLIQLLGFTSTSLKREQAQKFMDNDSYLIQIIVETTATNEEELDFDHGFIDINQQKLAETAFESQEEVLFNALNVYRVVHLDLESAVRRITLKYGAVVDLVRSRKTLKGMEASVLENYRHCVSTFKLIEDDGDALRLAQEHEQCMSYYLNKVQSGGSNAKNLGKLAGAQLELGDINAAYENAVKSLSLIQEEVKHTKLNPSYEIPLKLNSNVFGQSQDVVNYERSTNLCLQLIQSWEERSQLILDRAEKKLNIGDYKGCYQDLKLCQSTLKEQEESFDRRRSELKRQYFFSFFCCFCSQKMAQIEDQRETKLLEIQEDEILFLSKKDLFKEFHLKKEIIMGNFCSKIGDEQGYKQALKNAQEHITQLEKDSTSKSNIQIAKYQVLKANAVDIKNNFTEYENLMEDAIENVRYDDPLHPNIARYNEMLGFKRYEMIQHNLTIPRQDSAFPQTSKTVDKFDYDQHKVMYKKCRLSLKEAADQFAFQKGTNHIRTMTVNSQLATLDYDFSLLRQAEDKTKNMMKQGSNNTEGAKCHILLAKIALAKGQLKRGSVHIQKATAILKNSLIKFDNPEYDKVLLRHPLYLEISILRAKVYNRQQKHQLALKELQMLQRLVKLQKPYNVALLANLQEQQAQILVCLGETQNFQSCVLKSVQLREQAMGKYNIPNAISFSNLFKYLRYTHDFQNSVKYHQKSTEIFSRFPSDHPNAWVLHLSNGLIFFQRKQYQMALPELQMGLRIAERRYSSNHINFMKIKLQFAKLLKGMGQLQRSLRILQSLQVIISKNIKESALQERIQHQTDDQKILVRKNILIEMKQLYQRSRNDKNIVRTMLGLERCEVNLRECEEFISDGEKIDSLKSLT